MLRVRAGLGTAVCGGPVAAVLAAASRRAECTNRSCSQVKAFNLCTTVCIHARVCDCMSCTPPPLPTTSTSGARKHDRCVPGFAFDLLSCFSLSHIRARIITCGCFRPLAPPFLGGYFKHFEQSSLLGI